MRHYHYILHAFHSYNTFLGTTNFNLDIMPTPFDIFSALFLICVFQSRDSSMMTPRNVNDFTHWIIVPFAEIESMSLGALLFLERKMIYLVLS